MMFWVSPCGHFLLPKDRPEQQCPAHGLVRNARMAPGRRPRRCLTPRKPAARAVIAAFGSPGPGPLTGVGTADEETLHPSNEIPVWGRCFPSLPLWRPCFDAENFSRWLPSICPNARQSLESQTKGQGRVCVFSLGGKRFSSSLPSERNG